MDQQKIDHMKDFEETAAELSKVSPELAQAMEGIKTLLQSAEGLPLEDAQESLAKWFTAAIHAVTFPDITEDSIKTIMALSKDALEILTLLPELGREINRYKQRNGIKKLYFADITQSINYETGELKESIFRSLINSAAAKTNRGLEYTKSAAPDSIYVPVDKVTSQLWLHYSRPQEKGLATTTATTTDPETGEKMPIKVKAKMIFNFDDLPANVHISKQLTRYDRRGINAAASLFNKKYDPSRGCATISANEFHRAIGGTSRPNPKQIKKVFDFFWKMRKTDCIIDNSAEAKAPDCDYMDFPCNEAMINCGFSPDTTVIINGQLLENPIRIYAEPVIIRWAKNRDQGEELPPEIYQFPLNMTEFNMAVEDFLLERAMRAAHGTAPARILLDSFYRTLTEDMNFTISKQLWSTLLHGRKGKEPAIKICLDHLKLHKKIDDYQICADCIDLIFFKKIPQKTSGKDNDKHK